MTKSVEYYLLKIVASSDGPSMAEKLSDSLSDRVRQQRSGKNNVFKSMNKSKRKQELENLEIAILKIMRQTTDMKKTQYELVVDRMHQTGMDTSFKGPLPPSIKIQKAQLEAQKMLEKNETLDNPDKGHKEKELPLNNE